MKPFFVSNQSNDSPDEKKDAHSTATLTRSIILAVLGAVTFISMYRYHLMLITNPGSSLSIPIWAGPVKSPLDQFEIRNLLSLDAPILANLHISLTNIGLYLTITAFIALGLNLLATNYNKVIANS